MAAQVGRADHKVDIRCGQDAPPSRPGGRGPYIQVVDPQGGDFDDLYPDVCVEGLEKDPF